MKNNNKFQTYFKAPIVKRFKRFSEGGQRLSFKRIKKPLFSIITVVLNGEKNLEQTIKSVISQKIKDFEYIVLDGGSTDNTIKIIKKYSKQITYWVSEKDQGIYHAFNKGMQLSRGKYVSYIRCS